MSLKYLMIAGKHNTNYIPKVRRLAEMSVVCHKNMNWTEF